MKNLKEMFSDIKKSFTVRKKVEFPDVTIEMEPLTTLEELNVLEACKDYEKGSYIEALKKSSLAYSIKKINDIVLDEDLEYEDENGKIVKESKYLFILHQLESWPSAIRDVVFDAFNNMQIELEDRVSKQARFERFTVLEKPEAVPQKDAGIPEGFRKIEETSEDLETDVDRLNKAVKDELDGVQSQINKVQGIAKKR